MKAGIAKTEALGAAFMILSGSALHFAFEWSSNWQPVALIAAVNESIWEHLKLAFWPGLFWVALSSHMRLASIVPKLAIRGFTLLITAVLIVSIFSTYTGILGQNYLALDIGTFAISIVIGQVIAAWLSQRIDQGPPLIPAGLAFLAFQVIAFSLFTFFPPDHWLFIESSTGIRGIPDLSP